MCINCIICLGEISFNGFSKFESTHSKGKGLKNKEREKESGERRETDMREGEKIEREGYSHFSLKTSVQRYLILVCIHKQFLIFKFQ